MSRSSVRLIHWHPGEAAERAAIIAKAGYQVAFEPLDQPGLRELRDDPPDVCVIDLTRVPSHGRDVGVRLRGYKATRHVPLVFVGGEPEKVERVRGLLPDAIYTEWSGIAGAIRRALSSPPSEAPLPNSAFAAFAGTPLIGKLGIREGMRMTAVNAPEEFEETIGELPDGARMEHGARAGCDLVFWFVRSRRELEGEIEWMRENIGRAGIWIAWPKKSAAPASDITQFVVRQVANGVGLADYKICSIDSTWTAMRFAVRKER